MKYEVPSSRESKTLLQSKLRCYGVIAFAGALSMSSCDNVHIFQEQYSGKLLIKEKKPQTTKHTRYCYSEIQAVCEFVVTT